MSRYHASDPGLRVNHDNDEDTPNSSRSAIGFQSVVEGKKHMRKMTARRRFQRAVNKVRTINRIRLSVLQQQDEQTPLVNTNGDDDDEPSSIARESDSGGDKTAEDKDATDTNHSGHGFELSELQVLSDMVFGHYVSLLLLFAPVATVANLMGWSPFWVFWLNFLTMIPLASILGDFTQEVALHTNQVIGGLVNATFGNIVEIIVGVQALLAGQYRVVQASMLGSILSNLLLVLGCCFFFGGLRKKEQSFNVSASTANMSLLALSSIALVLPTPFAHYYVITDVHVLDISRIAAVFLIFMYLQLLYFQLRTHAYLFEDDDDEEGAIPLWTALFGLLVVTIAITFFSQFLVNSINGFTASSGLSHTFVGIIILPIVGNAVEHITAVTVAMKDKMDLAMGVAIGSCTQISLFVVPLLVIVGWIFNKDMTLNFPHFEIILYVLSILTVAICLSNPKSNWLEGSLMITCYILIAVGFYFEKVQSYTMGTSSAPTMMTGGMTAAPGP